MDKKEKMKILREGYRHSRGQFYQWIGVTLTLTSAILGFTATKIIETNLICIKIFGYAALACFGVVIIFGLFKSKKSIEREHNEVTGLMAEIDGKPLNKIERKAIDELNEGKIDYTLGIIFWVFGLGLLSLLVAIFLTHSSDVVLNWPK